MACRSVGEDVEVAAALDFESVFRDQYPRLVAFGVAMTGDVEVARDLAQETMARAHVHWDTVESTDAPPAWLRRVMRNLVVDHLRRRGAERRAVERIDSRRTTDDPAERAQSQLAELLAVLPERQRTVVSLYYVDDLPTAEIATVLGIAQGTVKALLWKARRTLARHLRREHADG